MSDKLLTLFLIIGIGLAPEIYAASPFATGTTSLKSDLLALMTPVAGIGVIGVGATCLFGQISWWWFVGVITGIVLIFGSDQIVSWVRGMFSV